MTLIGRLERHRDLALDLDVVMATAIRSPRTEPTTSAVPSCCRPAVAVEPVATQASPSVRGPHPTPGPTPPTAPHVFSSWRARHAVSIPVIAWTVWVKGRSGTLHELTMCRRLFLTRWRRYPESVTPPTEFLRLALDPERLAVLGHAAVGPVDIALLAKMLDVPPRRILQAVRRLRDAGLLTGPSPGPRSAARHRPGRCLLWRPHLL